MKYGYARVSTTDQDLTIQQDTLRRAGCDIIRGEKVSGTSRQGRRELETLLDFIRDGDSLVVTRIDRLARSMADLLDIVKLLESKGVALICTEQPIDTSTAMGRMFLSMLGIFAEFETDLRKERQMEGIAAAKIKGDGTVRNFVCEALSTLLIRRWRARSVHRREWRTVPLPWTIPSGA